MEQKVKNEIEALVAKALKHYYTFESFGVQLKSMWPKRMIEAGRKLCNMTKEERRICVWFLYGNVLFLEKMPVEIYYRGEAELYAKEVIDRRLSRNCD